MATSAIPAAFDYLYTTAAALPQCQPPAVVSDGWPTQRGDVGIAIGVTPDDADTDVDKDWAELGARAQWEQFAIPCIIWAHRVGGERPMRDARAAAFAIFDALDTALRTPAGTTLGNLLRSGTAYLTNPLVRQTNSAAPAGEGRTCEIHFAVVCKSRSTP